MPSTVDDSTTLTDDAEAGDLEPAQISPEHSRFHPVEENFDLVREAHELRDIDRAPEEPRRPAGPFRLRKIGQRFSCSQVCEHSKIAPAKRTHWFAFQTIRDRLRQILSLL